MLLSLSLPLRPSYSYYFFRHLTFTSSYDETAYYSDGAAGGRKTSLRLQSALASVSSSVARPAALFIASSNPSTSALSFRFAKACAPVTPKRHNYHGQTSHAMPMATGAAELISLSTFSSAALISWANRLLLPVWRRGSRGMGGSVRERTLYLEGGDHVSHKLGHFRCRRGKHPLLFRTCSSPAGSSLTQWKNPSRLGGKRKSRERAFVLCCLRAKTREHSWFGLKIHTGKRSWAL